MQNNQPTPVTTAKEAIARLNDELRFGLGVNSGGRVVMTQGMLAICGGLETALGWHRQAECLRIVRDFDEFTDDNNPHAERDFGSFEFRETKCFWKIDYYDLDLQGGSPNPADPKVTRRVLTILRADEY